MDGAGGPGDESFRDRLLAAGGTGYLGGYVVQELKTRGYSVRALVRSAQKLAELDDSVDEIVETADVAPLSQYHTALEEDLRYQANRTPLETPTVAGR